MGASERVAETRASSPDRHSPVSRAAVAELPAVVRLDSFELARPLIAKITSGAAHGIPFSAFVPHLKQSTEQHSQGGVARRAALQTIFACYDTAEVVGVRDPALAAANVAAALGPRDTADRVHQGLWRVYDFFTDSPAVSEVLLQVWQDTAAAPDKRKHKVMLSGLFAHANYQPKRDAVLGLRPHLIGAAEKTLSDGDFAQRLAGGLGVVDLPFENTDHGADPHFIQMLLMKRVLEADPHGASLREVTDFLRTKEGGRVFNRLFDGATRHFTNPGLVTAVLKLMLAPSYYEKRYLARVDVRIYRLVRGAGLTPQLEHTLAQDLLSLKARIPQHGFEHVFWPQANALKLEAQAQVPAGSVPP